jgi:hypothetical protein
MAVQLAVSTRNARLDAIETDLGAFPILELRSGSAPADCATADSGTLLCSMTLPADAMAAASSGSKAKSGTWSGTGHANAGAGANAGHFRLKTSGGVCKLQGSVTATGGGGDLTLDNINIAQNQAVSVSGFTLTDANA